MRTQRLRRLVTVAVGLACLPATVLAQQVDEQGAAALGLALRRLGPTQRVLMIGAHPDDENTAILSELALGHGADVAYLSLSRGEGGQNLIGPELQEGLGLIRTEELLAARRLDGAHQFFSRAYDFGFSKTAAESFQHWPQDSVLEDVVEVIRKFRPDVIIAVFSGTPRDGHGQHQVSGIVAREAFRAAADPARFPAQIAAGLPPHRTPYLFQALYRPSPDATLRLRTGDYDPLLGYSHYQVAMASRSRHRSQDMGQAEPLGPRTAALIPVDGPIPTDARSIFAGLDTTLAQRARANSATAGNSGLVAALDDYQQATARARSMFNPLAEAPLVPVLARGVRDLDQADSLAVGIPAAAPLRWQIARERQEAAHALELAAGVTFDATAADQLVAPGEQFDVTLTVWNGGTEPLHVTALAPDLPAGWEATPANAGEGGTTVAPETLERRRFHVRVPADAQPTEAYYLRQPRSGDLYRWPANVAVQGLPFQPPSVRASAHLAIQGTAIALEQEATFVDVEKSSGERRLPVLVVPAVAVTVDPQITVVPLARAATADDGTSPRHARTLTVELDTQAPAGISGTVHLEVPPGWRVDPDSVAVRFTAPGESRTLRFQVVPPAAPEPGKYPVRVAFISADGQRFDRGYHLIDYPHIRPHPLYRDAVTTVSVIPVEVAAGLHVGYIEGAGDDGAEALRQLGLKVDLLGPETLASGDLSQYDVIVTGIRAYEVRPDLDAHNDRLLDYVRKGGTAIIQYNKYEYVNGHYAPYPLTMARPHDRVTDENAPVRLLDPSSQVLSWPNRIGSADFVGWIQERGLYFAHTWDDHYKPLLAMADPGEAPLEGSLLVAQYGKGTYVYTGLSFFRELPVGVPGAYRLFANLVSLAKKPGA